MTIDAGNQSGSTCQANTFAVAQDIDGNAAGKDVRRDSCNGHLPAGRDLLNLDAILASVENIWQERKAVACLNPLHSYMDQVIYEEDRFAETCEDNPFLKQLGKLFRYYGYQARTAIDQLRTDMFTQYLAFRTVFILQSNGHIQYALTEPILALLSEPQEEICHEEDDPLEQTE